MKSRLAGLPRAACSTVAWVLISASCQVAGAGQPSTEGLWSLYQDHWRQVRSYSAAFSQKVSVPGMGAEIRSGGHFFFSRPDLMRWDYEDGKGQLVVGDGTWLWIYQPELEQVYRIDYQTAFGQAGLLALLSGDGGFRERYHLSSSEKDQGTVALRLASRDESGEIIDLVISLDGFDLEAVVVTDPAGSITSTAFYDVALNEELDMDLFRFSPPSGVDVIDQSSPGR